MARAPRSNAGVTPSDLEEEIAVTSAPSEWEWETVADEQWTRVIFDTIGDTFVGKAEKQIQVNTTDDDGKPSSYVVYLFRGRDNALYGVISTTKIAEGMKYVKGGDWVRIVYDGDIPTRRGGTPMKNMRVDVRRK